MPEQQAPALPAHNFAHASGSHSNQPLYDTVPFRPSAPAMLPDLFSLASSGHGGRLLLLRPIDRNALTPILRSGSRSTMYPNSLRPDLHSVPQRGAGLAVRSRDRHTHFDDEFFDPEPSHTGSTRLFVRNTPAHRSWSRSGNHDSQMRYTASSSSAANIQSASSAANIEEEQVRILLWICRNGTQK